MDVGYGQLAWKLREDPRVVVIERTNIRYYDGKHLDEKPALAVIDVSFISLKTVIPAVLGLVRDDAWVLALIKPQFEARREEVGKNGVVTDAAVHDRVVEEIRLFCLSQNMEVTGTCLSPLVGPCLLYTSDAADDLLCVDLGGRRIIKKKKNNIVDNIRTHHKKPRLHKVTHQHYQSMYVI